MTALFEARNLSVRYPVFGGLLKRKVRDVAAVKNVSFSIEEGDAVGLVGESGSGKTSVAMAALGLAPMTGSIFWRGRELSALRAADPKAAASAMQIVFQDPYASLDPRMRVRDIVAEGIMAHRTCPTRERRARVIELLAKVGLDEKACEKYPHEFSGGQRQRIAIARALSLNPTFLFLDEAVSALDLLVQAQILNLLQELKRDLNLTYLFITHDLGIVEYLCDRVLVMHRGEIVEEGATERIFDAPKCDYTKKLLAARQEL